MSVVSVVALAGLSGAVTGLVLSALTMRRHDAWMREGRRLSVQFDRLMRFRESHLDCLVARHNETTGIERAQIRAAVERWFYLMDRHCEERDAWSKEADKL